VFKKYFAKIKFDPYITAISFFLLLFGFSIFFSASLGVFARYEAKFYGVIQNQFMFGVLLGSLGFFLGCVFPQNFLKKLSPYIYGFAVLLCVLVFVPGIGMEHGGARRWIEIAGFSLQPSEVLKYASIILLGTIYSFYHEIHDNYKTRFLPILFLGTGMLIVLIEPDLGTSTIITSGILVIFFLLSAKWHDVVTILIALAMVAFSFYTFYPHARERVNTFMFPEKNSEDQNYQVKQTKISLGSGGLWGDGYGQSIQKYHHLPEPIGDSVFAVVGEEFGFVGGIFLLIVILSLSYRLIIVSTHVRDPFGKSVLVGTGTVLLVQAFLNAGSSSGAIPFTGVPFPLVSHGSTSIIITMTMLGLCAQISAKRFLH
jgi:cell division protein FtsW